MSTLLEPSAGPAAAPENAPAPGQRATPWWWVMLAAAVLGIGSATITIVEKIAVLKEPGSAAFCDINESIGCTPVLLAPQSSVLGPPNAAIGLILFAMFASAGLAGVLGSRFPRSYRWTLLGLAVFFACFLTWYMGQVGFVIGSLCPFCAVCAACVLAIVLASTRLVSADLPAHPRGLGAVLATARRTSLDVIVVVGWTVLIAGILAVGILT